MKLRGVLRRRRDRTWARPLADTEAGRARFVRPTNSLDFTFRIRQYGGGELVRTKKAATLACDG